MEVLGKGLSMSAALSMLDPREVAEKRVAILRGIGRTREELEEGERAYSLGPAERDALRRLRMLEFLDS